MKFILHRLYANNFKQLSEVNLYFPSSGTILIEGHNEAGKSSLFEAVYFALYGGSHLKDTNQPDLKQYGADEMKVELEFSVGERRFKISRKYAAQHSPTLEYRDSDGNLQTARTIGAVQNLLSGELSLSKEALLNTCFVAQKELGKLEDLSPDKRAAAINELLNLEVITKLKNTFRVERAENETIQYQKARVEIAELDTIFPRLQTQAAQAERKHTYAQILRCEADWQNLAAEIISVQTEIARGQAIRQEIAAILDKCTVLQARIKALDSSLMHLLSSWNDAEIQETAAARRVETLREIECSYPDSKRALSEAEAFNVSLETLETLEAEAGEYKTKLADIAESLTAYDHLLQEWEDNQYEQGRQEEALKTLAATLREAETHHDGRQNLRRRLPRLDLLLQHTQSHAALNAEAEKLAAEAAVAAESAALLPEREAVQRDLETAARRIYQRDAAREKLARVKTELAERERRADEHRKRLASLETLAQNVGAREEALAAAKTSESDARTQLNGVEIRLALEDWVQATERKAQTDPHSGSMNALETERAQAQTAQTGAEAQEKRAVRWKMLALLGIVCAVLGGAIGFALNLWPLVIRAAIALICCVLPFVQWTQKARAARAEVEEAKGKTHALAGQIKQAQAQIAAYAIEKESRSAREADCRRHLESLGETVPADFAVARERIAALPALSRPDAQAVHQDAVKAVHQAEAALTVVRQQHETECEAIQLYDVPAAEAKIIDCRTNRDDLTQILNEHNDLPAFLAPLGVAENPEAVQEKLSDIRREIAAHTAQANRREELERQHSEKWNRIAEKNTEAAHLAGELNVPGENLTHWNAHAAQERAVLLAETERLSDAQIEADFRSARENKDAAELDLTIIRENQKLRRKALDAINRPQLEAASTAMESELAANMSRQAELSAVRPALLAVDLPTKSGLLQQAIARMQANLQHLRLEIEKLPAAKQTLREGEALTEQRREAFGKAWESLLPDKEISPTIGGASSRLPEIRDSLRVQFHGLREAEHRADDRQKEEEITALGRNVATLQHRQTEARKSANALLPRLPAEPETPLDTLPARFPELTNVSADDVETAQIAERDAHETVQQNRHERREKARLHTIEAEALDLAAEKKRQGDLEKQRDVKNQATVILEKTRQAIIGSVMPLTMNNMNRLLPLLTEGRYHQAEWNRESNMLSIYDNQARGYQKKTTFSGGARDQISLALRLAFAMATLPGEHAVRPGWLFLDEPLSSFDRQRTLALVSLLTKGLIRKQFDQIFLVSHSEAFDANLFDHRLRMDGGRVADCSLPVSL